MKMPARKETAICVPLTAAMFFVIFSSFDLTSINTAETPIRIRATNPVASPMEMSQEVIASTSWVT
jgi:hypothetical protein